MAVPALLVALLMLRAGPDPAPEPGEATLAALWADAVLVPPEVVDDDAELGSDDTAWPDDYRAIEAIAFGS